MLDLPGDSRSILFAAADSRILKVVDRSWRSIMRILIWLVLLSALLTLNLGCDKQNGSDTSKEGLDERLKAAKLITDLGKRDPVLAKIAEDAAAAGDIDHTNKAI